MSGRQKSEFNLSLFGDDTYRQPHSSAKASRDRTSVEIISECCGCANEDFGSTGFTCLAYEGLQGPTNRTLRVVWQTSFPLFQESEFHQSRFFQNVLQTISFLALNHNHVDGVAANINSRQPTIAHCADLVRLLAVGQLGIMRGLILTKR
jgi:hypothetical protein